MNPDLDSPPVRHRARRRHNRLTRLLGLTAGFSLAFHLGVRADRLFHPTAPPAPAAAAAAEATDGPAGPPGSAVTGRVEVIDGHTLYVHDGSRLVKVTAATGHRVSKAAPASLGDIQPGHEITVRGNPQPDGTLSAVSLTDTTDEGDR